MRVKNKYIRNHLFKRNTRNRVKNFIGGEFKYKSYFPYGTGYDLITYYNPLEQLKQHQHDITRWVNDINSGSHTGIRHAPKWFKKQFERKERRSVQCSIKKIMSGYEDVEIQQFKHNADYVWF